MKKYFRSNHSSLYYESPVIISLVMGLLLFIVAMLAQGLIYAYERVSMETDILNPASMLLGYFKSFRDAD